MAKAQSDIFICSLGKGGYWAYPSPFVAHGGGAEIQFRNLTHDDIEIDLKGAPVDRPKLFLGRMRSGSVVTQEKAAAGLYEYEATVTVGGLSAEASKKTRRPKRIKVKGGSSPKIIIDA